MMVVYLPKKQWSDLSVPRKVGVVVLAVLQITLLVAALVDIRRRPAGEINGSKKLWAAVAFVNFVGPIAYFVFGRKR